MPSYGLPETVKRAATVRAATIFYHHDWPAGVVEGQPEAAPGCRSSGVR